jgi:hypothetical protein
MEYLGLALVVPVHESGGVHPQERKVHAVVVCAPVVLMVHEQAGEQ